MESRGGGVFLTFSVLLLTLTGCAPHARTAPPSRTDPDLRITLMTQPATPRQLDPTQFTVRLRDAAGRPVTQAVVTVALTMPAMDMGRDEVGLRAASPGVYDGTGRFTMAGDWAVNVTATRGPTKAVQSFPMSVQ